jgi:hypothetical protein
MDYADVLFLSDGTSLWDFTTPAREPGAEDAEFALYVARVEERYGVDASDVGDGNLTSILQRISVEGRDPG